MRLKRKRLGPTIDLKTGRREQVKGRAMGADEGEEEDTPPPLAQKKEKKKFALGKESSLHQAPCLLQRAKRFCEILIFFFNFTVSLNMC